MAIPPINFSELEYEDIYNNIKDYIKSKSEFSDFDFDGSALSTILDMLTFNTYYQLIFQNILVNEMFLDSSQKIESLRSHAKLHGYTIQNKFSSVANISFQVDSTSLFNLSDYERFTGTKSNGTVKNFYAILAPEYLSNGSVKTATFDVYEAQTAVVKQNFSFDFTTQSAFIPNQNFDFRTLMVEISTDGGSSYQRYSRGGVSERNAEQNLYYIESNGEGFDVKLLNPVTDNGNFRIRISYLIPSGDSGNNISQFSIANSNAPASTQITVNSSSSGGREISSLSNLKFSIPRVFASQERAVTESDIKSLLFEAGYAGSAADVVLSTPSAGVVRVSVDGLSGTQESVINFLQQRGVVGVSYEYETSSTVN